jgi:hypothetical protein
MTKDVTIGGRYERRTSTAREKNWEIRPMSKRKTDISNKKTGKRLEDESSAEIAISNDAKGQSTDPSSSANKPSPEVMAADQGMDFLSRPLVEALNLHEAQALTIPTYRPNWKAAIERHFRAINTTLIGDGSNATTLPDDS